MNVTLPELADFLGGRVKEGDTSRRFSGFGALDDAGPDDVSFFALENYRAKLAKSRAGAILIAPDFSGDVPEGIALVEVEDPSRAFNQLVEQYSPSPPKWEPGIHESAVVDLSAQIGADVCICPNAVVEKGARVGDRSVIGSGAVVGANAELGADCMIHPNATIAWGSRVGDRVILHSGSVIGGDGFGFDLVEGRHRKVEQVGIVVLGDDVEIGASSTVDRARFGITRIGSGTKIDNQVQIGHNVWIGEHCIIVAGCGIAGSCKIGDRVTIAAQVGVAGHLEIVSDVVLGARTGVTKSITEPGLYFGFPHQTAAAERRQVASMRKLPEVIRKLKELDQRIADAKPES